MWDQRGGGKLGVLLWLAMTAAAIFAAVRIVPVKIKVMELHDFADSEIRIAGATDHIDEVKLIDNVLQKAKSLELPLARRQLKLDVGRTEIHLRMQHEVTVDLEVYQWVWQYDDTYTHMKL